MGETGPIAAGKDRETLSYRPPAIQYILAEEGLGRSIGKVKNPDAFFLRLDYWADRDYNVHVRKIWHLHRQMWN